MFARRNPYLDNQNGIIRRYAREKAGWDIHLEKTRQTIAKRALDSKPGTAVVLGSGWLLDVPLELLMKRFRTVCLVDIAHPPQLLHKYRNEKKLRFLSRDLTGGTAALAKQWLSTWKHRATPPDISSLQVLVPDIGISPDDVDFCASVNTLSQLDNQFIDALGPAEFLTQTIKQTIRSTIQQAHLEILPAHRSILVTDYRENYCDKNGKICSVNELLDIDTAGRTITDRWQWKFDTHNTYHPDYDVFLDVLAVVL